MVNTGGCGPLVELLGEQVAGARVPACMALGFIAGQSDQLAMAVIESKVGLYTREFHCMYFSYDINQNRFIWKTENLC